MFSFDGIARVATAAVGALILSTLTIAAAAGPAVSSEAPPVLASIAPDVANG